MPLCALLQMHAVLLMNMQAADTARLACLQTLHAAVHIQEAIAGWLSLMGQLLLHLLATLLQWLSGGRLRLRCGHQQLSGKSPPPPRVLAAVVAQTDASSMPAEQVAALVQLCASAGFSDVSVYDPAGMSVRTCFAPDTVLFQPIL